MKLIVFDLECTCEDDDDKFEREIIEIGAIKVEPVYVPVLYKNKIVGRFDKFKTLGTYQTFVKPVENPELTDYCLNLTGIKQDDVDCAKLFVEALPGFLDFIKGTGDEIDDSWICSWGHFDRIQLAQECKKHTQSLEWLRQHSSIKHEYAKVAGLERPMGLLRALEREGFEFEGSYHRAMDDTKNTLKIFQKTFPFLRFTFKDI